MQDKLSRWHLEHAGSSWPHCIVINLTIIALKQYAHGPFSSVYDTHRNRGLRVRLE
jgi:hypothetical protein